MRWSVGECILVQQQRFGPGLASPAFEVRHVSSSSSSSWSSSFYRHPLSSSSSQTSPTLHVRVIPLRRTIEVFVGNNVNAPLLRALTFTCAHQHSFPLHTVFIQIDQIVHLILGFWRLAMVQIEMSFFVALIIL